MNYRHAYHAGNHADALKHAVLLALLQKLTAKPAPFAVLDTHAGIGRYDLTADEAARTGEWRDGIGRLLDANPPELADYLAAVRNVAPAYPGSPQIARAMLREQDRLLLCELHPDDSETLKRRYASDGRIAVHRRDGYEAIGALLPPKPIGRGLVLIDPPYERADEEDAVARALQTLVARWPHAQMALWYPIKDRALSWRLHEAAFAAGYENLLAIELTVVPEDGQRMAGSGVLLGNAPYEFEKSFAPLLGALHAVLDRGGGHARLSHALDGLACGGPAVTMPCMPATDIDFPFAEPPAPGRAVEIRPGLRWARFALPFRLDSRECLAARRRRRLDRHRQRHLRRTHARAVGRTDRRRSRQTSDPPRRGDAFPPRSCRLCGLAGRTVPRRFLHAAQRMVVRAHADLGTRRRSDRDVERLVPTTRRRGRRRRQDGRTRRAITRAAFRKSRPAIAA